MGDNLRASHVQGRRSLSMGIRPDLRSAKLAGIRPDAALDLESGTAALWTGGFAAGVFLVFGSALRLAETSTFAAVWPEAGLFLVQVLVLAASFRVSALRPALARIVQGFCWISAAWLIFLAAATDFESSATPGLLVAIPALGVAVALVSKKLAPTGVFLAASIMAASAASIAVASTPPVPFIASLVLGGGVSYFALAGWLGAHHRATGSERFARSVVGEANDGIVMIDLKSGRFLDANPAFCRMIGQTVPELRKRYLDDVFLTGADEAARNGRNGAGSTDEARKRKPEQRNGFAQPLLLPDMLGAVVERQMLTSAGEMLPVELRVDRTAYDGEDVLTVVVEDRRGREEYEARLLKARECAEEIAGFKSALLANMSHEIRTPLSSILGWAAVLTDELPDRQRELVRQIEDSGQRLLKTLNAVIELAHLHANAMTLRPALVDVNKAVETTVRGLAPLAEEKGLEVIVHLSAEEAWAELDSRCLHRSFVHILENAIKFTERGRVTVSVRRLDNEVAVRIEDTGAGINDEFLPMIFEEFKQESEGLARDHEGNGLGLAITRRLIEMIGGRIDVESEPGVGSAFTVYVPEARTAAAAGDHSQRRYAQVS